jgi:peptide/nickel transport system ATP-binding protein
MNTKTDTPPADQKVKDKEQSKNQRVLLQMKDVRVWYTTIVGEAKVVDGVDVAFYKNEVFGLAGESGCGKSTLVEGLLRLIKTPGYIKSGEAFFNYPKGDGQGDTSVNLFQMSLAEVRPLRWRHIAYVPQGAMNSLNPVMRIEDQITDAILEHSGSNKADAQKNMARRLEMVGLPASVARMYPHELSGGMKQRVTIAAAVTLRPELLVADEPTTALDVNVQRVILQELLDIRKELGLTVVYVSHDMAVHAELADRMGIMYAGVMMEVGHTIQIFKDPLHPYTQGLIRSIPDISKPRARVDGIPGMAPSPLSWPQGCRFHPRCPFVKDVCKRVEPHLVEVKPERSVACHMYTELWNEKS